MITTSELVKKSSISSLSFTFIFCFNAGRPKIKRILLNIFPEKCLFHLHTRKKKSLPYFGGKVLLFFPGFFSPHKEFLHFFQRKVKNLIFIHKKRRKKNRNHIKKSFSGQKFWKSENLDFFSGKAKKKSFSTSIFYLKMYFSPGSCGNLKKKNKKNVSWFFIFKTKQKHLRLEGQKRKMLFSPELFSSKMYFSPGFTHGKVKGIYKDDKTFSSLKHRRENY